MRLQRHQAHFLPVLKEITSLKYSPALKPSDATDATRLDLGCLAKETARPWLVFLSKHHSLSITPKKITPSACRVTQTWKSSKTGRRQAHRDLLLVVQSVWKIKAFETQHPIYIKNHCRHANQSHQTPVALPWASLQFLLHHCYPHEHFFPDNLENVGGRIQTGKKMGRELSIIRVCMSSKPPSRAVICWMTWITFDLYPCQQLGNESPKATAVLRAHFSLYLQKSPLSHCSVLQTFVYNLRDGQRHRSKRQNICIQDPVTFVKPSVVRQTVSVSSGSAFGAGSLSPGYPTATATQRHHPHHDTKSSTPSRKDSSKKPDRLSGFIRNSATASSAAQSR